MWYYIRVAAENDNKTKPRNQQTVPWQINSNAALKIPREDESHKVDIKTLEYSERKKNGGGIWKEEATTQKTVARKFWQANFKHESLILAQDERWRRA